MNESTGSPAGDQPPDSTPSGATGSRLDLAVAVFNHIEGADHAYADVLGEVGQAPWTREIALVEHHKRGRIVVRGTFAGHYVDVDDESDLIGAKTAEGAVAGAAVGILAGPLGIAVGFVAGGMIGGEVQAHVIPALKGAFFDELRADVPENSSGVVLLANPDHVDAMVAAFEGHHGGVVRHQLTSDEAQVLVAAVADTPLAAPGAGS